MEWVKRLTAFLLVVVVIALVFHHRSQVGEWIVEIEDWIATLGVWGPLIFVVLFIALTSVFFPDSILSAVAGALFGVPVGMAVSFVGAIVAQGIAFAISRRLLHQRVRRAILHQPKLAAIQRAADRAGFRLQFLLRLTPLNPVAVSHVLGTTGTHFRVFLLACLGLAPALFVQVYLGYTTKHMIKAAGQVSQHSAIETVTVVVGLFACLLLFIVITRLAQKAIAEADL
jgi:uncharacterized membrane protein YdjX (TVP38/TMEM64 family)